MCLRGCQSSNGSRKSKTQQKCGGKLSRVFFNVVFCFLNESKYGTEQHHGGSRIADPVAYQIRGDHDPKKNGWRFCANYWKNFKGDAFVKMPFFDRKSQHKSTNKRKIILSVYCCDTVLQSLIPSTGSIKTGISAVTARLTASVNHQTHIHTVIPAIRVVCLLAGSKSVNNQISTANKGPRIW